jgi:hypothetical protein
MFETLTIKQLKNLIRAYNLSVHIPLSRGGKALTKAQIIAEVKKHVYVDERGEVKYHAKQAPGIFFGDKPKPKLRLKKKLLTGPSAVEAYPGQAVVQAFIKPKLRLKKRKQLLLEAPLIPEEITAVHSLYTPKLPSPAYQASVLSTRPTEKITLTKRRLALPAPLELREMPAPTFALPARPRVVPKYKNPGRSKAAAEDARVKQLMIEAGVPIPKRRGLKLKPVA